MERTVPGRLFHKRKVRFETCRSQLVVQPTSFVDRTERIAATGDLVWEVPSSRGVDRADSEFEGALLLVENVDRNLADA